MATPLWINRGGVLRRGFLKGSDLALLPSSTPPPNPSAGDLWIYPAGSNGEMWMFVYDTTDTSAYKWKFIGGPPVFAHYNYPGGLSIGNSTYTLITGCSLTAARAGDYILTGDAQISTGQAAATEVILALGVNSGVPAAGGAGSGGEGASYFAFPFTTGAAVGANAIHPSGMYRYEAANAGDVFKLFAWAAATGTNTVSMARFHIIPIRVA